MNYREHFKEIFLKAVASAKCRRAAMAAAKSEQAADEHTNVISEVKNLPTGGSYKPIYGKNHRAHNFPKTKVAHKWGTYDASPLVSTFLRSADDLDGEEVDYCTEDIQRMYSS